MKRRTVRAIFDQPEYLKAEDVSNSEILKSLLKVHVPNSIEDAIVNNKVYACVFEINDTAHYIEIHKNQWEDALETCLVWYVEEENYEMCTHIKNMIQSIKDKKQKRVSTKKKTSGERL